MTTQPQQATQEVEEQTETNARPESETAQVFAMLQGYIQQIEPRNAAMTETMVDVIAANKLSATVENMLLQELADHSQAGITALRQDLRRAKQAEAQRRKLEQSIVRQQEKGMPGAPVLRADPGVIEYTFADGDIPQGRGKPHLQNLRQLCAHHGITAIHNLMNHGDEIFIPGLTVLTDDADNLQLSAMRDIAIASNMSVDRIEQLVHALACENHYHPVLNALAMGEWDGHDRWDLIASTVETPTPNLWRVLLQTWMRQAVVAARAGYGNRPPRGALGFIGEQNKGKTSFFRKLASVVPGGIPGVFGEGLHLDPRDKDSLEKATAYWICELGELDATFRKSDIAALKAHLSSPSDSFRLPYAPKRSTYPRRTVYCFTANETDVLIDSTGNSRWWVIEALGFDLDALDRYLNDWTLYQVWKQAEAEIDAGAPWWLPEDTEKELAQHVEQFRHKTPIELALQDKLDWEAPRDKWQRITATAIGEMLGLPKDRAGHNGVGPALRILLSPYTGQKVAKPLRTDKGVIKGWEIPPWKFV